MPNFPIVDSHVHLYDVDRLQYGWLSTVPPINHTYTLREFDAARGDVAVEKIVFVEVAVDPGSHHDEAQFVQELASADPRLVGMVAHAPVQKGAAVADDLARLAQHPTLRGIRKLIQGEPDPSVALEPDYLEGVRTVGRHGLVFDICVKHWALGFGLELARRCPETMFVLDHIGKPGIKHGLREPWWTQIRELAALPNVVCKVSGVITEADHANWSHDIIAPYVSHVIECFGFDRCLYGSDWTVSELTHRYPEWVAMLDTILAGSSEDELRAFYRDTAERVYRV